MEVGGRENVRFGDFEFDLRSGKLFRGGRPVKIQPQPLRVLAVLLESAGETVSRESLRSRVWGDATFVEFDQGLTIASGKSASLCATALRSRCTLKHCPNRATGSLHE